MQFFGGLLITLAGVAIIVYTEAILSFSGGLEWASKWLEYYGGSRLGYKLIGLVFVIVGLLMMTGLIGDVVLGIFADMFKGFEPGSSR